MSEPNMEKIYWFDERAVYVGDVNDLSFNEMVEYCEEMKLSLVHYGNEDVSDVSLRFDTIAVFKFDLEEDALLFKLKYGGKFTG